MGLLTIVVVLLNFLCQLLLMCTGIKLVAKDGSVVHGRTLEFGIQIDTSIVVVPREYEFTGMTPQGPGLSYKAKYAAVGAIAYDNLAILDGINEKGLAVGVFYFPGFAGYSQIRSENQSRALSPIDFSNWILTQFGTIDEVKNALSTVVVVPTIYKEWGSQAPPFHYIVYDKSGESLVIEPIDGTLVTYNNPLGVFTNSPKFDWHMTNLRNYIHFSAENAPPIKIGGIELTPLGQGSGMVGLPGDFTPPSRFVRAAIFSTTAVASDNANEAVLQIFHILNQFDIPVGVVREQINGIIHCDYTLLTRVADPQSLMYYFKTYDNQSINVVNLSKFDFKAKDIKRASTVGSHDIIDISSRLK